MLEKHLNLLNAMARFVEKLKGIMSPAEKLARQKARQLQRAWRHAPYNYDSDRQRQRYAHNRMDEQQRNSHKPGTVQPFHIFGAPV